jgi:polysaccharide export outer membrane protein
MRQFMLLLPIAFVSTGCLSWRAGTIAPNELQPQLQAKAPAPITALQLANLGAPVHSRVVIAPGDLLDVSVSNLTGENQGYPIPVRVGDDGCIQLPLVGPVIMSGLSLPEAEQTVFVQYSCQGILKRPQVVVSLRETRKVRVYLLGAVKNPGQYELNGNECDLLSALVAAGGLLPDANSAVDIRRRVAVRPTIPVLQDQLRTASNQAPATTLQQAAAATETTGTNATPAQNRSPYSAEPAAGPIQPSIVPHAQTAEATLIHLDLANEKDKLTLAGGMNLQNGDIISVGQQKISPIYVVGMVNKPGEFPLPPDRPLRVLEAIGLAGGVDRASLPDKAVVIRQHSDQSNVVTVRIDLDHAKRNIGENILLMPGDIVSVEETAMSYARSIFRGAFRLGLGATLAPAYGF